MKRERGIERLKRSGEPFDFVIVGGGATGLGIAIDAASRGYSVALLEQSDFGKGTSSRSTKLVHGGVRYLQQGNVPLVMEALKERGILRRNAPHLVSDLPFVVPNYAWWEAPFYGIGMKVYDALAGRYGFGPSRNLSRDETVKRLPTIETEGLRGGVVYHDGQFDDARLLIDLAQTAVEQGAVLANYTRVESFERDESGFLDAVVCRDLEADESFVVAARVVVNATGPFSDSVRRMDDAEARSMIRPSQGVHVVLPRRFLPGDSAVMVPHTDDGRVLFAIPWHERVLVGTTDTPIEESVLEPKPFPDEIDFLLKHTARYLTEDPTPADVCSVFVGIRPLAVAVSEAQDGDTAKISREHTLHVSSSGLLTVAGGKWTTYRKMAQDAVDHGAMLADLEPRKCVTEDLNIHGHHPNADRFGDLRWYGSDAPEVEELLETVPGGSEPLHECLPVRAGEVVWAARKEMARTVEDMLARRSRSLLLDARAAVEVAPRVAELLAAELGRSTDWQAAQVRDFGELALQYILES